MRCFYGVRVGFYEWRHHGTWILFTGAAFLHRWSRFYGVRTGVYEWRHISPWQWNLVAWRILFPNRVVRAGSYDNFFLSISLLVPQPRKITPVLNLGFFHICTYIVFCLLFKCGTQRFLLMEWRTAWLGSASDAVRVSDRRRRAGPCEWCHIALAVKSRVFLISVFRHGIANWALWRVPSPDHSLFSTEV